MLKPYSNAIWLTSDGQSLETLFIYALQLCGFYSGFIAELLGP